MSSPIRTSSMLGTRVDPRVLGVISGDIQQLLGPFHMAAGRRILTHPGLLDQLREAVMPGSAPRGAQRHVAPGPCLPAGVGALDALNAIQREIAGWRTRLNLVPPSRCEDLESWSLRRLEHAASFLSPAVADWLSLDVHGWWTDAAQESGWRLADLMRIR